MTSAAEGILQSVETLQQANRRILDRLRPLYIQELGLERSIQTLLQNAKAQASGLKVTSQINATLNGVDGLLSQTIYRVIQEAVTNVLRHARANAMHVAAVINDREVIVEISDDGIGFPADRMFGRGLTGMLERVRALSGTLELVREEGRTCVRCRLPAGDPPHMAETQNGVTVSRPDPQRPIFLAQCPLHGQASAPLDLGVARKGEGYAHRLAFVAQIIEHDTLGGRDDFLQPESGGCDRIEARPPIGFEFGAAFTDLGLAAPAFERGVVGIEVEQCRQVAIAARVQPVDHQCDLIEIVSQIRDPIHVTMPCPVC